MNGENICSSVSRIRQFAASDDEIVKLISDYVVPEKFIGNIRQLYWALLVVERAVSVLEKGAEQEDMLYNNLVILVSLYVANVYNPSLLNDDDIGSLPALYRFGYYMAMGQNALEEGDNRGYLAALKNGLRTYPSMKNVVNFLTDSFLQNL
jgi:hypothetical protein